MATRISPGNAVWVRDQVVVDDQVAFTAGERVVVEAIAPIQSRPQYKYVKKPDIHDISSPTRFAIRTGLSSA
jgi:hypothetical protein